jgi:hypothetical protein
VLNISRSALAYSIAGVALYGDYLVMQRLRIMSLASILFFNSASLAQQPSKSNSPPPCRETEARQFDFWTGEWDLQWGNGSKGKNVIRKTLDGCVIEENFDGAPAMPLRGMSVSTYSTQLRKWQQTWVDNQGGYLDFVGGFDGAKMVLQRRATINGKEVQQRMVWYDITKDSLQWNWERSEDGGKSWVVLWNIRYSRKK